MFLIHYFIRYLSMVALECSIPSRSVKLFVKVIQCLSRIGEYVNFEAQNDKVSISSYLFNDLLKLIFVLFS